MSTSMSSTQKPCLFFLRLPLLSVVMTIFGKSRDCDKKSLKTHTDYIFSYETKANGCSVFRFYIRNMDLLKFRYLKSYDVKNQRNL